MQSLAGFIQSTSEVPSLQGAGITSACSMGPPYKPSVLANAAMESEPVCPLGVDVRCRTRSRGCSTSSGPTG